MEHHTVATRWGALIRHKRTTSRVLQVTLAATVGVTQATISDWERGVSVPAPVMQSRLIAALNIAGDDLAAIYAETAA